MLKDLVFLSSGMSTGMISDSLVMNTGPVSTVISGQTEVDFAECDCCGLMEECTPSYIEKIRERYGGKWICGLCAEAVKDEILRCHKLISLDEAMARHFSFCNKFRASGPPQDPTPRLIRAMSQILRKSLDSPKSLTEQPDQKNGRTRRKSLDSPTSLTEQPDQKHGRTRRHRFDSFG